MPDHLPAALKYNGQGFRPVAAIEKTPIETWKQYQHRAPTVHDRHDWWQGRGKLNHNIALVLGPACNLLVLNVNIKNGKDGRRALKGRPIPDTPTIRTTSGGLAYCFRPPDRARYPSRFGTYVYPKGYDGLEFRGSGGIQIVPPSIVNGRAYQFIEPWTLTKMQAQLADLPDWLLDAWLALDHAHAKPPTTTPTDLPHAIAHPPTSHTHFRLRSQKPKAPPAGAAPPSARETAGATPPNIPTITTTLSIEDYSVFEDEDAATCHDRECAAHVSRRVGLDEVWLDDGASFLCVMPGHRERRPSASWFRTSSGYYIYRDWHVRGGHEYFPVPDVYAALITGDVKPLPRPSRKTWRLRLMVEAGLLAPYPVEMKPLPDEMPALLKRFCEGFRLLCACKWTYQERAPTMFSDAFAAGWCGIREGTIWKLRRLAVAHGFMVAARDDKGRLVYLPGKDE